MAESSEVDGWALFGKFVGWLISTPIAAASRVFVAMKLWSWFVTPQFSIETPPWWVIYGMMGLITVATFRFPTHEDDPAKSHLKFNSFVHSIAVSMGCFLTLGVAYLVKTFGPAM